MAQRFSAFPVLPEDPDLVPSIYTAAYNYLQLQFRVSSILLWPRQEPHACGAHRYRQGSPHAHQPIRSFLELGGDAFICRFVAGQSSKVEN